MHIWLLLNQLKSILADNSYVHKETNKQTSHLSLLVSDGLYSGLFDKSCIAWSTCWLLMLERGALNSRPNSVEKNKRWFHYKTRMQNTKIVKFDDQACWSFKYLSFNLGITLNSQMRIYSFIGAQLSLVKCTVLSTLDYIPR